MNGSSIMGSFESIAVGRKRTSPSFGGNSSEQSANRYGTGTLTMDRGIINNVGASGLVKTGPGTAVLAGTTAIRNDLIEGGVPASPPTPISAAA